LDEPVEGDEFVIRSGEFVLACTAECIGLSVGRFATVSPLSHVARFGLGINCGADFVNPGFGSMNPTVLALELFNHNPSPLVLTAGMPIAHLRVGCVEAETLHARSVYEGKDPLAAPRFFEEMAQTVVVGTSR
jgi:dCTP deaminase